MAEARMEELYTVFLFKEQRGDVRDFEGELCVRLLALLDFPVDYWKKARKLSREMTTLDLNFGASGGKVASRLLILNFRVVRLP
jgi:hypothetical protein